MEKYQDDLAQKLKKLTVAELSTTLTYLKEWSRPVLTTKEFTDFEEIITKFSKKDGPLLQEKLMDWISQAEGSWLAEFWLEDYLSGRGSVQSETNFALVLNPIFHEKIEKNAVKAGVIIYQLAKTYLGLVEGSFPLEQTKAGEHLDMSFYRNFFKSIRIPGEPRDQFYRGASTTVSNFIVIIKNGSYFKLEVTDAEGTLVPLQQLIGNIESMLTMERDKEPSKETIHSFSAVERKKSYELYRELIKNQTNQVSLAAIAEALFIVSFNEFSDEGATDRIKNTLLHPENQMFTKTMQVVVTKNGAVGFNFEHSAIDGVPALRMLTRVAETLIQRMNIEENAEEIIPEPSRNLISKLAWEIPSQLSKKLAIAYQVAIEETEKFSINHRVFNHFGKAAIKKVRISPDAFFQIALVMAQYEVGLGFRSIYEPVAMRGYYQGRTESARSLSMEKCTFVQAFFSKKGQFSTAALKELLMEAVLAHGQRIALCQKGNGIERHLFGLKKMAEMNSISNQKLDYFFRSAGIRALQSDYISTTGIPYDILESFSFAPVNPEGFGLYYGLLDEKIILDISCRKEISNQAEKFLSALLHNLMRLGKLTGIEENKS